MEWRTVTLDCRDHFRATRRQAPFTAVVVSFDHAGRAEDRDFLDGVVRDGRALARRVHAGAANAAAAEREATRVVRHCVAGVLAERLWKQYLNREAPLVAGTPFEDVRAQIDLEIACNGKRIEVRSSMPRNGIGFAICHPRKEFDILGPYTNGYKPDEIQKDYYVRTLFHLEAGTPFSARLRQSGFEAWLTGGATWAMMTDDAVAVMKTLRPEEEVARGAAAAATQYRVVPFRRALDTQQIYGLVRAEA